MKLSQSKKNKIAWITKNHARCPDFLTYYDIKYALSDTSEFELRKYFSHSLNVEKLFSGKDISDEYYYILEKMDSLNEDDLRRIALIHGLIQLPSNKSNINKDAVISHMKTYSSDEEMNEFKHILINSFVIALSLDDPFGVTADKARSNLKLISEIKEEGYEDDSLYSQFMKLMEQSSTRTHVSDNSVATGSNEIPSFKKAIYLLFDFEDYDFQDAEWVGGNRKIGYTKPQDPRKRKILEHLKNLKALSFDDAINYFE